MLITLIEWDKENFSKPHRNCTLQKWAREGRFKPEAEKHGREWWVNEDAKLVRTDNSRLHRLRQAKGMQNDESLDDIDPRGLEILNDGSRAA